MGLSNLLWYDGKLLELYIFFIFIIIMSINRMEKKVDKIISGVLAFFLALFVMSRIIGLYYEYGLSMSIPIAYVLGLYSVSLLLAFWNPKLKEGSVNIMYALYWSPLLIIFIFLVWG